MDYYNYDAGDESSTTPYLAPAGCLDMMDFNIGDHMAYSKFLLGWIEPTVIKVLMIHHQHHSYNSPLIQACVLFHE